jgi:hypothetical protein
MMGQSLQMADGQTAIGPSRTGLDSAEDGHVASTSGPDSPEIVTQEEELAAFETIRQLLGVERPIGYEDSVAYFKIHLQEWKTWVFVRLQLDRRSPHVWVPMQSEDVAPHVGGLPLNTTSNPGWTGIELESPNQIQSLGALFKAAYQSVKQAKASN